MFGGLSWRLHLLPGRSVQGIAGFVRGDRFARRGSALGVTLQRREQFLVGAVERRPGLGMVAEEQSRCRLVLNDQNAIDRPRALGRVALGPLPLGPSKRLELL